MLLVVDNYDSFTFNLVQCFGALGEEIEVVRNDALGVDAALELGPSGVVISPGPGHPRDAGISVELIRRAYGKLPLLGVCLGHQCLAHAFGGRVSRAPFPLHGRSSPILHDGSGLFRGVDSPFAAARYHSLAVDPAGLPPTLRVTARATDGTPMAISDEASNAHGVQFHPESFLTPFGSQIISNFLNLTR